MQWMDYRNAHWPVLKLIYRQLSQHTIQTKSYQFELLLAHILSITTPSATVFLDVVHDYKLVNLVRFAHMPKRRRWYYRSPV